MRFRKSLSGGVELPQPGSQPIPIEKLSDDELLAEVNRIRRWLDYDQAANHYKIELIEGDFLTVGSGITMREALLDAITKMVLGPRESIE